jgi:hypothetical protein
MVVPAATAVERASGLRYPPYYVEPILNLVSTQDNVGGVGILYARTLPVQTQGRVVIVVQLSAPFVMYATKTVLKLVLAHEFLHYVDLVGRLSSMSVASEMSSAYVFEERFSDMERLGDALAVFRNDKRLPKQLAKRISAGLEDDKLNQKCKKFWIEKQLPMARLALGLNQVSLQVNAIVNSQFDPKVRELALSLRSSMRPLS